MESNGATLHFDKVGGAKLRRLEDKTRRSGIKAMRGRPPAG